MQVHVLNYVGNYKTRVSPGYCDEIAHYSPQLQGFILPQTEERQPTLDRHSRAITPVESCPVTNIDAINDPRLETANQFIFILEQNEPNRNIYQTLVKEIDQIVALANSTSTGSYKKEFTLIVHNDETSRVLLSTYNPSIFIEKFKTLVTGMLYNGWLSESMGLWSIVQAQKSNIKPTAQVYYFTNQMVKNVKNITRKWDIIDRDIEFNFFTIADGVTTEIFALPAQLELVQKMSNGRIIPLGVQENTLVNLFGDIMPMTALTTDNEKYDCHTAPFTLDAFVEKETQQTVFQFVGTGLIGISIQDAAGKVVPFGDYTRFQNLNFKSVNIDTSKFTAGKWKVSVSTARGGCQVSVRHQSTNGVIYGFTDNSGQDVVNSQIPLQRSATVQNEMIYTAVRIKQPLSVLRAISSNLEIQLINRARYDMPVSYQNISVLKRDAVTCSYNFMTPKLSIPKKELTTWTLTSFDSIGNLILRRIFYYYQHSPADTSICHGGQVDKFGQCICPQRYTGEYCWDRICAPGATLSNGICSCSSGFYGDFCELELMMPHDNATTVSEQMSSQFSTGSMSLTTTPSSIQTSTKTCSGFHSICTFLIVSILSYFLF
uniref:EGF-like domain-containing protein n=1 Tax=Caenorhabditis japonica TaxID=281687 RepID=A0A8R1I0S2_CAEJA